MNRGCRIILRSWFEPGFDIGQVVANGLDSADDIRAGLTGNDDTHSALALEIASDADVLDRVGNVGDVSLPLSYSVVRNAVKRSYQQRDHHD
jgi:hypothetical protein